MKAEMRIPQSIVAAITQDIFIKSCQINYGIDQPTGVKVCILYPTHHFEPLMTASMILQFS
jgi:leucoanthocyanidin reductase